MRTPLIIFGTGDLAQLANYYFSIDSNFEVVAFTVDKAYMHETAFEGKPLIAFEDVEKEYDPKKFQMFVAIGYAQLNKLRTLKCTQAKSKGYNLVSYISSKCSYLSQFPCGENCFILEDSTIQPFVKIGDNVTLWSGSHVGHHSTIESNNFIAPHAVISGHCVIKPNCFIGLNSTIGNGVTIAKENLIGAGSVVIKNTLDEAVIVPARSTLLNKKSSEIKL